MFQRIRSIIQKILPKGKFARGATILTGGTVLSQGLAIIAAPLLTRLYSPSDFGALAIFISILSVMVVVVSLKYQLAIPLPQDDEIAINVMAIAMISVVLMTAVAGLLLLFFGEKFAHILDMKAIVPYLWIVPVSLFGAGVYQVLSYWALRKQDFTRIARTKINQGIANVLTQVIVGLLTKGPLGLLLGDAIGRTSGSGSLFALFWKRDRQLISNISWEKMKEVAIRYRNYPLISSLSGLVNSTGLQVAPIMLASYYGAAVVGWFSLTQRIIGIPMRFIGLSVASVYTSEAARLVRENPNQLKSLFTDQTKKLALIGGIPILLIGLSAPLFFSFIFGPSWEESGQYAQVLSIMFAIQFVVTPLSQTLNILERQSVQLIWDAGRLVIVIATIFLCAFLKLTPIKVILAYSISMSIAYLILFLMAFLAIKHYQKNIKIC